MSAKLRVPEAAVPPGDQSWKDGKDGQSTLPSCWMLGTGSLAMNDRTVTKFWHVGPAECRGPAPASEQPQFNTHPTDGPRSAESVRLASSPVDVRGVFEARAEQLQ